MKTGIAKAMNKRQVPATKGKKSLRQHALYVFNSNPVGHVAEMLADEGEQLRHFFGRDKVVFGHEIIVRFPQHLDRAFQSFDYYPDESPLVFGNPFGVHQGRKTASVA